MLVLPLNDGHDRKGFDCGDAELNDWLSRTARQHKAKGVSSTLVAVADETSAEVLGSYAVSLAELVNADLPVQYGRRLPTKVPVFRPGRLATARQHQGKGIGEHMLFDAIDRVTRIAKEVGGIGLVVDAKHSAVDFYKRMVSSRWRTIRSTCSCRSSGRGDNGCASPSVLCATCSPPTPTSIARVAQKL